MDHVIVKGEKKIVKKNKLKLKKIGITDISEIEGLEKLINLEELDLRKNNISEIKGLNTLTNLTILNLRKNQISEIKGLEKLINLKKLNLSENNISEIKGLDHLKNLEYLNLNLNNISEIKGFENLTNLLHLDMFRNTFTEIKGLENLTKLAFIFLGVSVETHYCNLNDRHLSSPLAGAMGIYIYKPENFAGDADAKAMVRYCLFLKETGDIDSTFPQVVDLYREWEELHFKKQRERYKKEKRERKERRKMEKLSKKTE